VIFFFLIDHHLIKNSEFFSKHKLRFYLYTINFFYIEEGWVVSSESCGFLSMGAKYVRDVFPGEIVEITKEGFHTVSIMGRPDNRPQAFCIFEYVYFARPDSIYEGIN